jgi:DNA-binding NarL/FixJ family response regulator
MSENDGMRIVVAEDSAVLREGIIRLLGHRGHDVVAEAADAAKLLTAVAEHRPDAAVIDVRMPPDHTDEGVRAALDIRRTHPDVGILIFSQYVETRYATRLLAASAGGIGYLLKERVSHVAEFVDALERVAVGGTVFDPDVVTQLLNASIRREALATLSPRERQVLRLMAEGRSNAAIAQELVVSERAVEKHISGVFTKLDIGTSTDEHRRVTAVLHYLKGRR